MKGDDKDKETVEWVSPSLWWFGQNGQSAWCGSLGEGQVPPPLQLCAPRLLRRHRPGAQESVPLLLPSPLSPLPLLPMQFIKLLDSFPLLIKLQIAIPEKAEATHLQLFPHFGRIVAHKFQVIQRAKPMPLLPVH